MEKFRMSARLKLAGAAVALAVALAVAPAVETLGSVVSAAGKAATKRAVGAAERQGVRRAATGKARQVPLTPAEISALRNQHLKLDRQTLDLIEKRYGGYIPAERLQQVKGRPSTFLDKKNYQACLQKACPEIPKHERSTFVGHYDPRSDRIHIDRNQELLPRIVAHERLHQLSHPRFKERFNREFDEGTTDYFSANVRGDLHIPEVAVGYQSRETIEMLSSRVGEQTIARAYFRGEIRQLEKAVDQELGRGAMSAIARYVEKEDFHAAQQIIKRGVW